jgi:hypothetical protein
LGHNEASLPSYNLETFIDELFPRNGWLRIASKAILFEPHLTNTLVKTDTRRSLYQDAKSGRGTVITSIGSGSLLLAAVASFIHLGKKIGAVVGRVPVSNEAINESGARLGDFAGTGT